MCLFKEIASLSRTHKKIQNPCGGERDIEENVGDKGCTPENRKYYYHFTITRKCWKIFIKINSISFL